MDDPSIAQVIERQTKALEGIYDRMWWVCFWLYMIGVGGIIN